VGGRAGKARALPWTHQGPAALGSPFIQSRMSGGGGGRESHHGVVAMKSFVSRG